MAKEVRFDFSILLPSLSADSFLFSCQWFPKLFPLKRHPNGNPAKLQLIKESIPPSNIYILKQVQVKANKSPIGKNCQSNVCEQGNFYVSSLLIIPTPKKQRALKPILLLLPKITLNNYVIYKMKNQDYEKHENLLPFSIMHASLDRDSRMFPHGAKYKCFIEISCVSHLQFS